MINCDLPLSQRPRTLLSAAQTLSTFLIYRAVLILTSALSRNNTIHFVTKIIIFHLTYFYKQYDFVQFLITSYKSGNEIPLYGMLSQLG